MLIAIALSAALALCSTIPAPLSPATCPAPKSAELFPMATEALVFDPDQSLAQLVSEYSRVTGQGASIGAEAKALLASVKVSVSPATTVPPAMVQQIFEQVLVDSGFMLGIVSEVEPRMYSLVSLTTRDRSSLRRAARYVAREDLEAYRRHPAVLISTVVALPNTDVTLFPQISIPLSSHLRPQRSRRECGMKH